MKDRPYLTLGVLLCVHLLIMFALTYSGVNALDDVFVNLNRFYMAVLMVAPMVILMVLAMWHMYENRRANIALIAVAALVFVGTFAALRNQTLVGDEQFLRSMIPHHSVAIKTCTKADITDAEIERLCDEIVKAQREEIAQMREILDRLG